MAMVFQRPRTGYGAASQALAQGLSGLFGQTTDQRLQDQLNRAQIHRYNADAKAAAQALRTSQDKIRARSEAMQAAERARVRDVQRRNAWQPETPVEPVALNPGAEPLRNQRGAIPTPTPVPVDDRLAQTNLKLDYIDPENAAAIRQARAAREAEALVRANVDEPVLRGALMVDPTKIIDADTRMIALGRGDAGSSPTYSGTGLKQQAVSGLVEFNNRIREGKPLNQTELQQYRVYAEEVAAPEFVDRFDPKTGQYVRIQVPARVAPGLIDPRIVPNASSSVGVVSSPNPAVSAPPVGPVPAGGVAPDAATADMLAAQPAASPGQFAQPGAAVAPGITATVTQVTPSQGTKRTELQSKMLLAGERLGLDLPTIFSVVGFDPGTMRVTGEGLLNETWMAPQMDIAEATSGSNTGRMLANRIVLPERVQLYHAATKSALNTIIRIDSGAAVPLTEYPQYAASLIPVPGEQPAVTEYKMRKMMVHLRAYELLAGRGLDVRNMSDEMLDTAEVTEARRQAVTEAAADLGIRDPGLNTANTSGTVVVPDTGVDVDTVPADGNAPSVTRTEDPETGEIIWR